MSVTGNMLPGGKMLPAYSDDRTFRRRRNKLPMRVQSDIELARGGSAAMSEMDKKTVADNARDYRET